MRMACVAGSFVAVVMFAGSRSEADPPRRPLDAEAQAQGMLQGDWELADETFFRDGFLRDFGLEDLHPRISKAIRVEKDRLHFGTKLEKQAAFQLGTLGERRLIAFPRKDAGALVGIYEVSQDRLKVCVIFCGIPDKCEATRAGVFAEYKRVKK